MKSTATSVSGYITEQPEEWHAALKKLRAACRKHLRGYSEEMAYGMPGYTRDGVSEIGFAKQANYLSFYVLKKPVLDAHRADLAGLDIGKGCIRYRRPDQIDWNVVEALLIETAASSDEIC